MIDEIRKVFATKTSKIIKSTLWKVRDKGERPRWIPEDHWDGMVQKWGGVPFQQASARNRANRAADAAASVYTGGSISTLKHKKRFVSIFMLNISIMIRLTCLQIIISMFFVHHRS